MCKFSINKYRVKEPVFTGGRFEFLNSSDILDFHRSLEGYEATPLISMEKISKKLGIKKLYVKDESKRFGVKAFKPLGASYAIFRVLKREWELKFDSEFDFKSFKDKKKLEKLGSFTFCAASDGNHGRAVAWTANRLGQKAVIYMPEDTVRSRIKNIENEGAEVKIIDGTYDDCVKQISIDAKKNGWIEVGDTAYEGYTDIPSWVLNGYSTIFNEIEAELGKGGLKEIDILLLQAGVGAFAAAGTFFFVKKLGRERPKIVIVEPDEAACYLDSIKFGNGKAIPAKGKMETIMAGLNCGIPSIIAWPIIRDSVDIFISIPDRFAKDAMRSYAEEGIISGESGASGLAGLIALSESKSLNEAKEKLGINQNSTVLVINTEGDTDPENYKKIVSGI